MERHSSPLTQDVGDDMSGRQGSRSKGGNSADRAAAMLGEKLESVADTLRGTLPHEGRLAATARAVTEGLELSGYYLHEQGLTGAIDELESIIRRYPIQALLIGAGLGYALSRFRAR